MTITELLEPGAFDTSFPAADMPMTESWEEELALCEHLSREMVKNVESHGREHIKVISPMPRRIGKIAATASLKEAVRTFSPNPSEMRGGDAVDSQTFRHSKQNGAVVSGGMSGPRPLISILDNHNDEFVQLANAVGNDAREFVHLPDDDLFMKMEIVWTPEPMRGLKNTAHCDGSRFLWSDIRYGWVVGDSPTRWFPGMLEQLSVAGMNIEGRQVVTFREGSVVRFGKTVAHERPFEFDEPRLFCRVAIRDPQYDGLLED